VKQAAESGAAELRKSLQQEQERTGRLEQDLAAARRDVEAQTALAAKANADATQLKQTAGDTTELKAALQRERERAERLEQGLAAARRDAETQTALAARASEKAGQLKQTAENGTAELRKSLQEARERAAQLEQDLAVTRRDVKIQTALATQASDEATQLKQGAENCCAELKRSLQKEHDRAEALAQDLSMVHTAIYAYEAQTGRASDLAAGVKQAAESSAAELRNSLVREWERAARLHQSLAVTRGDVATQTALAIRVRAEAGRPKDVTEDNCVELLRALQQERDKTARLQRELVSERRTKDAHSACRVATTGQVMPDKQVEPSETRPVAKDQATVAEARGHAPPNREDAAEVAKLVARAGVLLGQGDVGSARIVLERAAETGNAQASFNLAETYDPLILAKWRTYGTRGDATRARGLYARAQAGGIKEATERLDALRR
jgi:DNA repair exonuclease SbcCD ATPase subunit